MGLMPLSTTFLPFETAWKSCFRYIDVSRRRLFPGNISLMMRGDGTFDARLQPVEGLHEGLSTQPAPLRADAGFTSTPSRLAFYHLATFNTSSYVTLQD